MARNPLRILFITFICTGFFYLFNESRAQHVGIYFDEGKDKITFPIEIHNNLVVIPVIYEGKQLKFILDTGVRSTILINKEFAEAQGIQFNRQVKLYGAGGIKSVNAFVTNKLALTIPGLQSAGISTLVLENDFLKLEQHLGTEIHGLIGYDIFGRFVVRINYQQKRITILRPEKLKVKKKYIKLDIEIEDSKPLVSLSLQLNDQKSLLAELLIDTGASHALVLNRHSASEIELPRKHIKARLGRSLTGEIDGYLGRIDRIAFGEKALERVITSFPGILEKEDDPSWRNGSIGGEMLKKFHVIFNYPESRIYLKPNRSFNYPFEYNMSGLEFVAIGEDLDRFMISNIRAEAAGSSVGFLPGDVVVSLNNVPSEKLNLSRIYTLLNDKAGKQITLTVFRDGQYISRTFLLKREI